MYEKKKNQNFEMNFTLFVAMYAFTFVNQSNNIDKIQLPTTITFVAINWTLPIRISNDTIWLQTEKKN